MATDDGGLYCYRWPEVVPGTMRLEPRHVDQMLLDRISALEKRLDATEAELKMRSTDDG